MYKLAITTAVCAGAMLAQTTAGPTPIGPRTFTAIREFGPIGITAALAGPTANIKGAPYSAQVETSRVQTLADGNRIEQTTTGSVARDSQGRVRREESLPSLDNSSQAPHLTFIEDPVAGVHWTLDPRTKTAMKMPFGPMNQGMAVRSTRIVEPALPHPPGKDKVFFFSSDTRPAPPFVTLDDQGDSQASKADLGTQAIEGVPAQGTRIARTIPAGKVGNSLPLVITTETWYSPDLKVLVMSKVNDPRMGETIYKLTNIQRVDPPPSTFEVPPDYTVREGQKDVVFQVKKP